MNKISKTFIAVAIIIIAATSILVGCKKEDSKTFVSQDIGVDFTQNRLSGTGGVTFVIRGVAQTYTHTTPEGHTVVEIYCMPPYYDHVCCRFRTDQIEIYDKGASKASAIVYGDESSDDVLTNTELDVTNCVVDTINHYVSFVLE